MRTIVARASSLDFALLGLIHRMPSSGYDLRKVFATSPLARFSDSPGAIYPALARLQRRRWIRPEPGRQANRRGRVAYRLTRSGDRAFRAWLATRPSRAEVVRDMDTVMLRFAFMGDVVPPETTTAYLDTLRALVQDYITELDRYLRASAADMPVSGRLAFESGIEGYRAYARWAARAGKRLHPGEP